MRVSDYDQFVRRTDQSASLAADAQLDIAIYGLCSELGSVVAAIKKRLLAGDNSCSWNVPNDEIIEELGDVIWYCFSLARAANRSKAVNIFSHDIANLRKEIGATDERALKIARVLDPDKRAEFLRLAKAFPAKAADMEFEAYQDLAILTARTRERTLARVCVAVLWQLGAELFRRNLPEVEIDLNRSVVDRPVNTVLGEIAWHVSALASIYGLRLSDIAEANMEKVGRRWDRSARTPLHDANCKPSEQFPRQFEIKFISVGPGRSRMYMNGKQLGDDLTDNSYEDDGYRYHDVMHLANVAKLGWSPVLRSLMGRKRKSDHRKDEVEDGARARIVEEALIKAIHSEGQRHAALIRGHNSDEARRLFKNSGEISFTFLKLVASFVNGLEAEDNRYWEWEEAIIEGFALYDSLRTVGQGTVTLNLDERTLLFNPHVFFDIPGRVAGQGSAAADPNCPVLIENVQVAEPVRLAAQKLAVLDALDMAEQAAAVWGDLELWEHADGRISHKVRGLVQARAWERGILGFRISMVHTKPDTIAIATALTV